MATKKEIKEHLKIALEEVGEINPWFDKEVNCWVFSHKYYPVEYGGDSPQDVIKNYPKYLKEFIAHRLEGRISDINEKETRGRGGYREGAGRPKGYVNLRETGPAPKSSNLAFKASFATPSDDYTMGVQRIIDPLAGDF